MPLRSASQLVLVTGATGYLGRRLLAFLRQKAIEVWVLTRDPAKVKALWPGAHPLFGDLTNPETLGPVCEGVGTVFHLASHADSGDCGAIDMHQKITVEGTRALLAKAVAAGVERFIFISSVKAMGEGGAVCMDEHTPPAPITAYGRAKLTAERLVLAAGEQHGIHVSVIRPPLIYGGENKGHLRQVIQTIDRGLFPPLPEVHNRRSMVHIDDVVQALWLMAENPTARGQTYIVTDGWIYSTRYLYIQICAALGRTVPRWTVPLSVLRTGAQMGDVARRVRCPFFFDSRSLEKLIGSAWYCSDKIAHELGYRPCYSLEDALPEMVAAYRQRTGR